MTREARRQLPFQRVTTQVERRAGAFIGLESCAAYPFPRRIEPESSCQSRCGSKGGAEVRTRQEMSIVPPEYAEFMVQVALNSIGKPAIIVRA
jgi:hypothetical protein